MFYVYYYICGEKEEKKNREKWGKIAIIVSRWKIFFLFWRNFWFLCNSFDHRMKKKFTMDFFFFLHAFDRICGGKKRNIKLTLFIEFTVEKCWRESYNCVSFVFFLLFGQWKKERKKFKKKKTEKSVIYIRRTDVDITGIHFAVFFSVTQALVPLVEHIELTFFLVLLQWRNIHCKWNIVNWVLFYFYFGEQSTYTQDEPNRSGDQLFLEQSTDFRIYTIHIRIDWVNEILFCCKIN